MQWKLDALQEQCLKPRAREALAAGDRLTGPEERKVQQRARSGVEGPVQALRVMNPGCSDAGSRGAGKRFMAVLEQTPRSDSLDQEMFQLLSGINTQPLMFLIFI